MELQVLSENQSRKKKKNLHGKQNKTKLKNKTKQKKLVSCYSDFSHDKPKSAQVSQEGCPVLSRDFSVLDTGMLNAHFSFSHTPHLLYPLLYPFLVN